MRALHWPSPSSETPPPQHKNHPLCLHLMLLLQPNAVDPVNNQCLRQLSLPWSPLVVLRSESGGMSREGGPESAFRLACALEGAGIVVMDAGAGRMFTKVWYYCRFASAGGESGRDRTAFTAKNEPRKIVFPCCRFPQVIMLLFLCRDGVFSYLFIASVSLGDISCCLSIFVFASKPTVSHIAALRLVFSSPFFSATFFSLCCVWSG